MCRLSGHWLLNLLTALMLAMAPLVAAGGHHGGASCLESTAMEPSAMQEPVVWDLSAIVNPSESDDTLAYSPDGAQATG